MEEIVFTGKIALTGLTIFCVGFFVLMFYCILNMEDLIDYDVKWPRWIFGGLMATGALTMIVSLIMCIWM